MRFSTAFAATASLLTAVDAAPGKSPGWTPSSTTATDKLALNGLLNLAKYELAHHPPPACNTKTGYVRKEWLSLSDKEKIAYTDAVNCLQTKPSLSGAIAPGAKSRYDDFVANHINLTLSIHGTGNFLSWHRYFTWTYEQALRQECGYKGYQPYINWGKYAHDIEGSPLFDGSATSMTGNGAYEAHNGTGIPSNQAPSFIVPPAKGSGCVTSGPFKNWEVRLGPVGPALYNLPVNPQADGLGYNPRCLRRDINNWVSRNASTDQTSADLITSRTNIADFQNFMQGDFPNGYFGVHAGGHYWIGGDPGGDFYVSPGDPYFFLHHAQIDRTWWIWQNQDPQNRQYALAGTNTIFNFPPSANTTLDDLLDLGVNAKSIKIRDAMSTLDGKFCYIYI